MANINELMERLGIRQTDRHRNGESGRRHLASHESQYQAVGEGPGERGRPGGNRQGPRVPDAALQVALQHAGLRDLEVRLVGVPRVGDVLLHGQRRRERQRSVHLHHRSGAWERRTRPAWSCPTSRSCSRSGPVARRCWTKCWWAARSRAGSSPSRTRPAAPARCARWSASPPASTLRPAASRCRPSPRRMNSMPA